MFLVAGTLGDPALEDGFLRCRERLLGGWGWHDLIGIFGENSANQFACLGVTWNDRWRILIGSDRIVGGIVGGISWQIESEVSLSAFVVEPVAGEAVVGEDRADFFLEVDFLGIGVRGIDGGLLVGKRCVCRADQHNCYDDDSIAHHPLMREPRWREFFAIAQFSPPRGVCEGIAAWNRMPWEEQFLPLFDCIAR